MLCMLHNILGTKNVFNNSPLCAASNNGQDAVVSVLLSNGANINHPGNNANSPLCLAADKDKAVVDILLSNGADVNQADNDGDFPLIYAARKGNKAVVAALLSNGADVNQVNNDGDSPLHWASSYDNEEVITVLLSNGANVYHSNKKGQKPIDVAKNQKIKDMLIAHTNKQSHWFQAADQGDLAVIQQGINDKIDVNCRDSEGRTAAWCAATRGHKELVEYLITQHADLSIADDRGESPLYKAVYNGKDAVVAILLSHGADVNQADNNGWKPINVTENQKIKDMLYAHMKKKYQKSQQPVDKEALWFAAAIMGDLALIQQGINDKIDVNCRGCYGQTAVYLAAEYGHLQLVEYLISQHADLSIADNDGWSPLYIAAKEAKDTVVAILLSHGADVNNASKDGWSPLFTAAYLDENTRRNIKDMIIAHTNKQPPPQPSSPVPVPDDVTITTIIFSLLDEIILTFVEEDLPTILMHLALEKGEKPWGRSTVIFVGAGRAGKTGTERSMLGYAYEHTESTVGINNEYMFEVTSELANVDGDANFASGSRWLLAEKAEKEYENALAKLASAIQQGKVDKELEQKVVEKKAKVEALKKDLVKATAIVPVAAPSTTTQPTMPSSVTPIPAPPTSGGGGTPTIIIDNIQNNPLVPLSSTTPPDVDLEYALKILAKDLQMNSKLLLTFLGFGGQKAFESINQFFMVEQAVYIVVFNMECFLTPDKIPINPEKGITTWSECLKVTLHWLNTVVVHTMKQGNTKPAPIFIVGTHKDTVPSSTDHLAISNALMVALGEYNPALNSLQRNDTERLCFYPVDNTIGRSDPTMITLMKHIEGVIEIQDYVKKMFPLLWFRVLDWMNGQSRFYLQYDEVAKFAKECGFDMSTTQAVDDMLSMFHECSVLMWHNIDGLRHIVILSPIAFFVAHATNLLRQHTGTVTDATQHKLPKSIENKIQSDTLLRVDFAQMISTGIVTRRLLDVLLSEAEEAQVVMQLMITYALLVPLVREEGDVSNDGNLLKYLVPALLPEGTNEMTDHNDGHRFVVFFSVTDVASSDDCLRHGDMRDKGFLPGGLFPRLIAKLLVWSQHTTTARTWSCDKDSITLFFGHQKFHVTNLPDINAIQVNMFDRHTPLAIHARLKNILDVLKAECFQSLNISTFIEHYGDTPMQGAVRPSSGIRWWIPLSAIRNRTVFLGGGSQGVRKLTETELDKWFESWLLRTSLSDVELYDVFLSYRWHKFMSFLTAKLADILAQFTTGDNPPRPILTFLDIYSLEMGLNLQISFIDCLVRSRLMVAFVSWAALARMMTHDAKGKETTIFTMEDNVLIEWLCSLRLLHLKRIHVMPLFLGNCEDANDMGEDMFKNGVGGDFFERDPITGTTVLQRLPDVVAEPSVAKAVVLLTKAGVWTSGTVVEPSEFGLSSLSVRAIVTAMTGQLGIKASDSKNTAKLLRLCAAEITTILAKGGSAGNVGGGGSPLKPSLTTPISSPAPATSSSPYAAAWSLLHDPIRARDPSLALLSKCIHEEFGLRGPDDLLYMDDEMRGVLVSHLTPIGGKMFTVALDQGRSNNNT